MNLLFLDTLGLNRLKDIKLSDISYVFCSIQHKKCFICGERHKIEELVNLNRFIVYLNVHDADMSKLSVYKCYHACIIDLPLDDLKYESWIIKG